MFYKIDFEAAQHLCGIVSRYFDNIAESAPDFWDGVDVRAGDFKTFAKDFTFNPGELEAAAEIDAQVTGLARKILGLAE